MGGITMYPGGGYSAELGVNYEVSGGNIVCAA